MGECMLIAVLNPYSVGMALLVLLTAVLVTALWLQVLSDKRFLEEDMRPKSRTEIARRIEAIKEDVVIDQETKKCR